MILADNQVAVMPRPAATIVLLREECRDLEALVLRRANSMSFAAGVWAFPGGRVDADDSDETLWRQCNGFRGLAVKEVALRVAACRETFEEAGVLLVRNTGVRLPDIPAASFGEALRRGQLTLDLSLLTPWVNWITPSVWHLPGPVTKRFDTYFFIAEMPADQVASSNTDESQECRWLSLRDLTQIVPPIREPPTLFTLREIGAIYRELGSLQAVSDWAIRQPLATIMMRMLQDDGGVHGLLPWDRDYASALGEGVPSSDSLASRFRDFPSRLTIAPAVAR